MSSFNNLLEGSLREVRGLLWTVKSGSDEQKNTHLNVSQQRELAKVLGNFLWFSNNWKACHHKEM